MANQPVTTKATITTHTTEQSVTLVTGYDKMRIKNRNNYAIQFSFKSGGSATSPYHVPANTMIKFDLPTIPTGITPVLYYQSVHVGDVLEVEQYVSGT